ncbi:hypothetical protein PQX77_005876 [Marasmius sp. AFHP31]|nr:hypothetical protein PQX77_005876 [Marasmius sp. AFHP31]
MPPSFFQQVLIFLKKVLLTNPLFRTCRRFTWLLWSILTRRIGKGKGKGKGRKSLKYGAGAGSGKTDRNRKSGESLGSRSNSRPQVELKPISPAPIRICASETPSGLHPYSYNNPRATISSQELRPSTSTTFRDEFSTKNSSYPRISHPTTSGQVHGTVNRATASPAASVSRISVDGSQHRGQVETASRFTASPAASRVSVNVQPVHANEETFTESPLGSRRVSRLSLAVDTAVTQLDRVEDQFTSEPETIIIGNGGPSKGYPIDAPITMSPVEVSARTTLDGEPSDIQTKNLSEVYSDFIPMAPEIYYRYHKEDFIEPLVTKFELAPMTRRFQEKCLPPGWKEFLHPEGARYFLYEPKRIYTDADVYNPNILRHAQRLINEFDEYTRRRNISLSYRMNVTLDMFYEEVDDSCPCRYYIADHSTKTVFWLDKFDADQMEVWSEVKGVTEVTHIRHAIEAQYWYHCQFFPDSYKLDVTAVDELRDVLIYWMGGTLSIIAVYRASLLTITIPYTMDELQQMLTLTNNLRKNVESWRGVAAFARIMHMFVMFSAPDTHLRELGKIWVDRCIHKGAWNKFISNMNSEWQELILFGTVLLNANVAFLAIQSVDEATYNPHRSPAQVLSFLSVVSSIGSVIIGLMLARKNKVKHKEGATDAAIFLNSFEGERLGLETLAILYSVPYAFLMWGVLLFLAAFSFFCLNDAALSVRLIVPSAWIIISFLVVWCIFTLASWDSRFSAQNRSGWDQVIEVIKNTFNKTVEATKSKMIALGVRKPDPETPVLRLRSSPVRRISEMWRRASRKATVFATISSALGSGSRGGSRRVTEEVEEQPMAERPRTTV